jgi:hypothetical protein
MAKIGATLKASGVFTAMVFRTVAGDDLWLSEDYSSVGEPMAALTFIWVINFGRKISKITA